jgi:hypothetical protein
VADSQGLYDTYQREGVDAAMQEFFADNGLADVGAEAPPSSPCLRDRRDDGKGQREFRVLARPWCHAASSTGWTSTRCARGPRVVVAIGEQSKGNPRAHGDGAGQD